jgi:hypothetical protein
LTWAFAFLGAFHRVRGIVYRVFYRAIFYTDWHIEDRGVIRGRRDPG